MEERRRILSMLEEGKISVDDAERLLAALGDGAADESAPRARRPPPRFLRVEVDEGDGEEKVEVRVPIDLLRAGMRLAALLPKEIYLGISERLEAKGIKLDLERLRPEHLEALIDALAGLRVDVGNGEVRVFCE